MLIVQPTSTCDVCLERYAWESPDSSADTEHLRRPHAITCGHVFCYHCLQNLRTPRTCPLCRASFHLTRAVRIHVDLASPNSPTPSTAILSPDTRPRVLSTEETEARRLELRLAEAFSDAPSTITSVQVATSTTASGSRATTEAGDVESESDNRDSGAEGNIGERRNSIVEEARAWLDNASPNSYPILRALLRTLPSHGALTKDIESAQAETARLRSEREHLKRHIRRAEKAREQEAALSRSAEKGWLVRVAEVERECELKLTQAETERCRMEEELVQLRAALKESQAAQSDVLVQAHMQIHADQDRKQQRRQQLISQSSSTSLRMVHAPAPPYSPRQQERTEKAEVEPSASGSSSIAFPRTSSPTPVPGPRPSSPFNQARDPDHSHLHSRSRSINDRDRDRDRERERQRDREYYDYTPSHNPLPRPPEPIPLSRLPAFARPKPGSSAYSAVKALSRHGSASLRRGERSDRERDRSERKREKGKDREREARTDSEKDRRERRREKERERGLRDGERRRDRDRDREGATTDSGRGRRHGKDNYRDPYKNKEKGKERERGTDRGTDTSATETQERARRRERTRHASLVGTSGPSSFSSSAYTGVGPSSTEDKPIDVLDKRDGRDRDAEMDGLAPIPVIPRDVVGGWGLERSWRASIASSGQSGGEDASREELRTDTRELENGKVGSSYTKLGFRDDKEEGKGKEKEREGDRREEREEEEGEEGEEDVREDSVFVRSSHEYERDHDGHDRDAEQAHRRTRERERHDSFSIYPYDAHDRVREKERARDTSHELPRLPATSSSYSYAHARHPTQSQSLGPQIQMRDRDRERRTTLSAAPSALGLVLVPSPDGRGGYTYAYQYQQAYLAPQSTIQTASQAGSSMWSASAQGYASGKESVTPLASQFFRGTTAVNANAAPSASHGTEYATTLTRRATDTALSSLARARTYAGSTEYLTSQQAQVRASSAANNIAKTTAAAPAPPLHVPQPRRISQTIPEPPELDTSPRTSGPPQVQPHSRSFHTRDQGHGQSQQPFSANGANADLNQAYGHPSSSKTRYEAAQVGTTFYANANPSANMSLDSALASLGNSTRTPTHPPVQTTSVAPGAGTAQATGPVHTLRHQTSNSSTASASTGISLTGSTSRERRKQLLDAFFSDSSDPANAGSGSNRSSFTSENAHPHEGGNSKEEGGGKRTALGRTSDAGATAGMTGDAAGAARATHASADARRGTTSATTNNLTSTAASVCASQANPEAPRGVPSRDGRPSRGLSTRPASTQPQTQASQTALGAPTVYYAHHVPATTTSYARPVAYAQANVAPGTYPASTAQHSAYVYHVAQPSAVATVTGYAAYAGYYQQQPHSQPHAHNRSQTYTLPRPQAYTLPYSQSRSNVDAHAPNHGAATTGASASGAAIPSNWADRRQY